MKVFHGDDQRGRVGAALCLLAGHPEWWQTPPHRGPAQRIDTEHYLGREALRVWKDESLVIDQAGEQLSVREMQIVIDLLLRMYAHDPREVEDWLRVHAPQMVACPEPIRA